MAHERIFDQAIDLQPAGFVTRLAAFLIDQVIISVVLSVLTALVGIVFQSFRLSDLLGTEDLILQLALISLGVTGFILNLLYHAGFWVLAGQTPGKAFLGLAVIRVEGGPLRLGAAIVRWLGYWLSGILFLGYLWILVDDRRQALHDKLARTLVVYWGLDERWSALPGQMQGRWQALQRLHEKDTPD